MKSTSHTPSDITEAPIDKLRLRRSLSATLLGLAGMDVLGVTELEQKVMEIHAELDDSLAHLDRFAPSIEIVLVSPFGRTAARENCSKLEQRSSIVYLCIEIVAFAVAGIESRIAKTGEQAGDAKQRLRSLNVFLTKKLQLLVMNWLKLVERSEVSEGRRFDNGDRTTSPFHHAMKQIEPYFDVSVFSQLGRAIEPNRLSAR